MAKTTIKGNLKLYRGECFDPNFDPNFREAALVFEKTFGFYSKTFIPPNYLYDDKQNSILKQNHIELLQSSSHFLNENGECSVHPFFRKKEKYGCPGDGRNVGAEKIASGDPKAIKASNKAKFKGG